jgi:hypothetical protein
MSIFVEPPRVDALEGAIVTLAKLEATSNAIRLRIAGLSPDQLYRTVTDDPPIAELISQAVDREQAYLVAFERMMIQTNPRVEEPHSEVLYLDRDFNDDLALFFDLRRKTLDMLRTLDEHDWERRATLPDGTSVTMRELASWLQRHDARLLRAISEQRRAMIQRTGVNDLRDMGVAGKLGSNIAQ